MTHKDPFDRIFVAQTIVDHLTLITTARCCPSIRDRFFSFNALKKFPAT